MRSSRSNSTMKLGHINTSISFHQSPAVEVVLPIARTRNKIFLVFNKVSNFVSRRRHIIPRLILSRRRSTKWSKFKLSRYDNHSFYNPRFIREYQFSPSSTPLIRFHGKQKSTRSIGCGHLNPLLSMWSCLRRTKFAETEGAKEKHAKYNFGIITSHHGLSFVEDGGVGNLLDNVYSFTEEDSVDLRAEMFIRRFYEEMKMQIDESI